MATATSSKRLKRSGSKGRKTNEIQEFPTTILLKVTGQVTVSLDCDPDSDERYDVENDALDEHFSDLYEVVLEDSYEDIDLTVVGSGWMYVDLALPFPCTPHLSAEQIEQVLDSAFEQASSTLWSPFNDMCLEYCDDMWVIEKRRPKIRLTDLLEVRKGTMSRQKYQAMISRPSRFIPKDVLKAR
jgi:hypothetical protein